MIFLIDEGELLRTNIRQACWLDFSNCQLLIHT